MGKTFNITADCKPKQHYKAFIRVAGEKMVIELKIWRGNAYNECGEKQLIDYLEHYHLKKGYMLSFHINKNKKTGINRVALGDKVLIEAVV